MTLHGDINRDYFHSSTLVLKNILSHAHTILQNNLNIYNLLILRKKNCTTFKVKHVTYCVIPVFVMWKSETSSKSRYLHKRRVKPRLVN